MTNFLWGGQQTAYNLLTSTELTSLTDGSGSIKGPLIDNTTNKWQFGQLHLHLGSNSLAFTSASYVTICFLPTDATFANPPTYTAGTYKLAEGNYTVATIAINPTTQSANVVDEWVSNVPIPVGKFYTVLLNHTGVTLPASGNTLDIIPTPTQY